MCILLVIASYILLIAPNHDIMMQLGDEFMRKFDLKKEADVLLNNNIVNLLTAIHEYKGKQEFYIDSNTDILSSLLMFSRIDSISSSNRIEGISTSDKRITEIVKNGSMPINRSEEEIAGYKDVLNMIVDDYKYIDVTSGVILQLHRDLYKYSDASYGGKYKDSQNYIEEVLEDGTKKIRFTPLTPLETPIAIDKLCKSYIDAINDGYDPLLLIPIFIFDFVSIHPFNDGNGRMSRLLTLLLLYKSNYFVGKYISIEKLIEETKEVYYDALGNSSIGWHDNKNDYSSFVEYYLGIILAAYKEFAFRVEYNINKKMTAIERVSSIFMVSVIPISKSYIMEKCPDISETTIERSLKNLLDDKCIEKISGGRYSMYKWIKTFEND